jgi:hypothetical protein
MGAWGPGMQANDSALDAIASVEDLLAELKLSLPQYLEKHSIEPLLRIANGHYQNYEVLGIAEWLLDNAPKGSLDKTTIKYERLILDAMKAELRPEVLRDWVNPSEREEALLLFGMRLTENLTEDEKKIVQEYNEGLFTRMMKGLKTKVH